MCSPTAETFTSGNDPAGADGGSDGGGAELGAGGRAAAGADGPGDGAATGAAVGSPDEGVSVAEQVSALASLLSQGGHVAQPPKRLAMTRPSEPKRASSMGRR